MEVLGLDVSVWLEVFAACHNITEGGIQRNEWPDGEAMLQQEVAMIQVFGLVRDELARMREQSQREGGNRAPGK